MAAHARARFSFLTNLVLGVHDPETEADREAIAILQRLIGELSPNAHLEIIRDSSNFPTPWLRASRSLFSGLEQIRGMAKQERLIAD